MQKFIGIGSLLAAVCLGAVAAEPLPIDGTFLKVRDAKSQTWSVDSDKKLEPIGHTELFKIKDPASTGNAIRLPSSKLAPTHFVTNDYYPVGEYDACRLQAKVFGYGRVGSVYYLYELVRNYLGSVTKSAKFADDSGVVFDVMLSLRKYPKAAFIRVLLIADRESQGNFEAVAATLDQVEAAAGQAN